MSRLKMAAVAAALTFAPLGAAVAQDAAAPQAEAPASPAPVLNPADQAFQTQGQAFEQDNQAFMTQLQAVLGDASLDKDTKIARTDAIITEFTPKIEAFALVLKAYLVELSSRPESAEHKEAILAASENAPAQLQQAPTMLREAIKRDLDAQPQ